MPKPIDTFLDQLPLIERIIRSICRERGMDWAETEEFAGHVMLRLIENNYAIVAKFKGKSSFGTYITTVISRMLNDYRDHLWGKWRNSAVAKRMGAMAMDLERLLVRDARSSREAYAEVISKYPGTAARTLDEMAVLFPARHRPRFTSIEEGDDVPGSDVDDVARTETASRISSVVAAFIADLPKEDQLIFQFHFENNLSVPRIARMLGEDPQSVYRRLHRHLDQLRSALAKAGIRPADAASFIDGNGSLLDFHLKTADAGPSTEDEEPDGKPGEGAE